MGSMRRDCSDGPARGVVARRTSWVVVSVLIAGCGTSPTSVDPSGDPILPADRAGDAVSVAALEASLRRDAAAARGSTTDTPVRTVAFESILGESLGRRPATTGPIDADPRITLSTTARRHVNLAIAPVRVTAVDGPVSREATRGYLAGRTAIADGRPFEAIEPLRDSVRRGGGTPALRALAEACERAGRPNEAMDVRRELARRGAIGKDDRVRLVEALVRRRAIDDALAVQAAAVLQRLGADADPDPDPDGDRDEDDADRVPVGDEVFESIRFAELLTLADRDADARTVRTAIAALLDDGDAASLVVPPDDRARLRRFWIEVGDDAARDGDLVAAATSWARAAGLDPTADADPRLRSRRLRAAYALGRDLEVQSLLVEAADAPTADDLALASRLRTDDPALDPARLLTILEARAIADGGVSGSLELLVALDPARGGAMLERLAAKDRGAVAAPLVRAAFAGGPVAALEVATSIDGSIDGVDAAVGALLCGPVDDEVLLAAAQVPAIADAASPVLAELWRRHERPDLAAAALQAADPSDPVVRIAMLRLFAELAEPTRVRAVPDAPFDADVEVARIGALLASGEPELARATATALLDRVPEHPRALAAMARVESTRLGGEIEAVEFAARARRAGDRSLATMLDLAGFASAIEDGGALSSTARRTLAELTDDPRFRAILEADAAMAAGDAATAIARLEPQLSEREAREAVLMRLLAAWRATGRLAEGRLRIEALAAEAPADPVLADALFAIDRAVEGPRATAIEWRPRVSGSISGQPRRRLELVLNEIPESASEARRVALDRLERRPDGPARDIQRLAILLDAEATADVERRASALAAVERLDVEDLTPRLRRRLASVAAAPADGGGESVIRRIADGLGADDAVDVDTAIAIAMTLEPGIAADRLGERRLAPAWTRLDPEPRTRIAALAARDPRAAELVALLGLASPPATDDAGGYLRTAIAVSVLAGTDAGPLLDRLDRASAVGWDPVAAWPDGGPDDLRRLAAVASDATMLGRDDLSIELMERAVDARPDDPVLLNNLGYALLEVGRIDEATDLLERSRAIDPDSASTLDSIGCLRLRQGRHDAADNRSSRGCWR